MKSKHARRLPDPVNVRLPEPLLEELREQALKKLAHNPLETGVFLHDYDKWLETVNPHNEVGCGPRRKDS